MGDTNELMEFLSASLGATLDEIYQRLIDCDFTREDPGLAMFVVAPLNALGREGRGNRPTEVVLMLAFGESGTAERGRNRLMRWRRGEMSGHDLAREPGLGEQRDHRLGEMPLPVQPAQPLIGAKRQRDGPRACLNDMSWNPATNDQVIPPGSRHLIIGDSLVRDLNEIFVYGQTTILSFGGASVAQVIKMMEFQSEDHLATLIIMLGTNDVSRAPVTPENKWEPLLVCLLNELKEKYRPKLVILCTIPPNPLVGTIAADFMDGNVTRWNEMIRSLVRNNPGELRLLDLENMLRMTDHIALTKDGVHFNTQRGRHWINDVFQTQLREAEQESRATGSLARTNSTGGSRIRATVPESLANRLGPLTTETVGAATVAPSSNVRDRLGTAPPPRPQSIGSRLGRSVEQNNRNNSQTASRRNDPPATTNPASTTGPSTSTVPAEGIESGSRLLWNRSDPSHWGQYKTDMSAKLNMNTLTCREDVMRMTGGESPTVSRLYRIPVVDWLLAEQEKFSSSTSFRHVDLNGLPHDNTF